MWIEHALFYQLINQYMQLLYVVYYPKFAIAADMDICLYILALC